jgi:hypothetical protein
VAEHREVRNERLYLKEPGTERLRKSSAARLRHLLASGWREVERWYHDQWITVKVERSGVVPRMTRLPKAEPPPTRSGRFGDRGGRGGPGRSGPPGNRSSSPAAPGR